MFPSGICLRVDISALKECDLFSSLQTICRIIGVVRIRRIAMIPLSLCLEMLDLLLVDITDSYYYHYYCDVLFIMVHDTLQSYNFFMSS